MTNVTFTSPKMKQDITVHATAGDHSTLLAVAREHVIPLECDCEDGEFCTCAVQVSVLAHDKPAGAEVTEQEKTARKLAGPINKEQLADAETPDAPAPWRLACQFIVRDDDLLVKF